jgi:23S rRNA (uracil1939-C5)-methyltransferase
LDVLPTIASPQQLRYRNRISLKSEGNRFGYFEKKSHKFMPIDDCLIAEESAWAKATRESENEEFSFSQVNTEQNKKLIELVLNTAKNFDSKNIYDLYAGSGNFTFPLTESSKAQVVGVELFAPAVQQARRQIESKNWGPNKCEFYLSDVGHFLKRAVFPPNSLVLIDPPRAGCSKDVIESLAFQKMAGLMYISCNPASLARDLELFESIQGRKLNIQMVQPIDMFPQTDHVETFVLATF